MEFIAANFAPVMFAGLILFLLLGFPVAFSLGAAGLSLAVRDTVRSRGWAVGMLVATYVVSGLTQSMFAHGLSTSAFVVFGGLLLGGALVRDADRSTGGDSHK